MTLNILFASSPEDWAAYETPLQAAFDKVGLTTDLRADFPPDQVDYMVYAPDSTVQDFTYDPDTLQFKSNVQPKGACCLANKGAVSLLGGWKD